MQSTTVAILKPDAVEMNLIPEILTLAANAFLHPIEMEMRQFDRGFVRKFYSHLVDQPFFPAHEGFMTGGPSLAIVFKSKFPDAVEAWRELMGPTDPEEARKTAPDSIRALWGTGLPRNVVHGSDSPEAAREEMYQIGWVR